MHKKRNIKHFIPQQYRARFAMGKHYLGHVLGVERLRGMLAAVSFNRQMFMQEFLLFVAIFFAFTGAGFVSLAALPSLAFV